MTAEALFEMTVPMRTSAVLSDCGKYRYRLDRQWGDGPNMTFVMLNPSTADATQDDPTIRRCIGFAKRYSCGSLTVVNLFAYRATEPDELLRCPVDVVGPGNFETLREVGQRSNAIVVAAWGSHGAATPLAVGNALAALRRPLECLGVTKSGAPRHPLYVRGDAPLIGWPEGTAERTQS